MMVMLAPPKHAQMEIVNMLPLPAMTETLVLRTLAILHQAAFTLR